MTAKIQRESQTAWLTGVTEAGAAIDAACEACHSAYWHPRSPPATLPADEVFTRTAATP